VLSSAIAAAQAIFVLIKGSNPDTFSINLGSASS
jgi:hypothetical protein